VPAPGVSAPGAHEVLDGELLTTVRQPLHAMGEMAVERAITLLAGGSRRVHPLQLQTSLVERSSTAPPRGAADGVVTPG
jgi:LacI family transcriptional regulator